MQAPWRQVQTEDSPKGGWGFEGIQYSESSVKLEGKVEKEQEELK